MKNLIPAIPILLFTSAVSFSCPDKFPAVKADSVKKELIQYKTPENDKVYISQIESAFGKNEIKISEFSDWIEKDTANYLGQNYYYDGENEKVKVYEEIYLFLENAKDKPKFRQGESDYMVLKDVRITGNNFYSIIDDGKTREELSGRFVKLKLPSGKEYEEITGLLINRKGAWIFYFGYV